MGEAPEKGLVDHMAGAYLGFIREDIIAQTVGDDKEIMFVEEGIVGLAGVLVLIGFECNV
jgi:uncharacterized membrane protein YuzA (DUF378 family)